MLLVKDKKRFLEKINQKQHPNSRYHPNEADSIVRLHPNCQSTKDKPPNQVHQEHETEKQIY